MLSAGSRPLQIFLSAGEASGDLHGAELVRAIQSLDPGAEITCLGGPGLRAAGAEVLVDNREIAVVGLFEVVRHLRAIHAAWRTIRSHLIQSPPDVMVLIDFPDFNFQLARLARRLGIRVFYYISPQLWAWRGGRIRTLKRCVDRLAVILPFEADYYARRGLRADFVGHPLLDVLAVAPSEDAARGRYRPPGAHRVVGLLPGSRRSEVRTLLPILLDCAELIAERLSDVVFLLPVAASLDRELIEREVRRRSLPVRIVSGDTHGAIRASDLILTASGTVTLEAAILGTPMIITYRVSDLSYNTGRWLIKVSCVGLPNLIAGRMVVPELLQHEAKPDLIAGLAVDLLAFPERLAELREALQGIRDMLGEAGVADRVARLVVDTARGGNGREVRSTAVAETRGFPRGFHALNLLLASVYPFFALYYGLQALLREKYRESWLMRLGLVLPRFHRAARRIWIHALSVGEVYSVVPLVKALKAEAPGVEIVFSTATETGQAAARAQLDSEVSRFFYMPHDFPWAMVRLVERMRPSLFVLVETDIWPNLGLLLERREIPAVLVNGRLSPVSFARMLTARPLVRRVLERFTAILAQSREDRDRFVALGCSADRVLAMGNLKLDAAGAPLLQSEISALRDELGLVEDRKAWVAGSTHEGEEEDLARVHRTLLRRHPGLLLVLAPRNIRRGVEIAGICERHGLSVGRRSNRDSADNAQVYVLDTLGELRRFYGLADAVFIGGSLVPFGGHNPLEAVAQGKPVCWGPHLFNFREIERSLMEAGCGRRVESPEALQGEISRWLEDSGYREEVMRRASAFMRDHAGAAARIARFLENLFANSKC